VSFINPSAREFAHYDLIEKPDMLEAVLNSASAFDQLIFWKDSFPSPAQRTITNKIQPFADAIAERALGLLPLTDPSVSYSHRGLKIIWNPAVTEVTRLYLLFQSFNIMEREDLIQVVVENMFSKNPSKFADLMNPNDLTWLPEVLKPVLAGIRPTNQTEEQDICKVLRMEKWMELPQDMRRLRYVWDAADLVLQNIDDEYWPNVMRDSLIKRVQELSGEVSESMAADEISEIAEDLEALISEVDGIADHLKLDLINLRDKEHAAKTAEELAKASETEVVLAYGSTDRKESDEAVDEIFDGLLRQTEECQPYEKR
jgi:hypothetical protein